MLKMKKIINLNGTLVELNKIKGIVINEEGYSDIKLKSNFIKIELQNRKEYVFNPSEDEWELHDFNDEILIEFPNYEYVYESFIQIKTVWEEALNE